MVETPLYIPVHSNTPLQYIAAGTWKTFDVAIRVIDEKVMTGDGFSFIEEAISILKYVTCAHFWSCHGCIHASLSIITSLCCSREFQHEKLLKLYGICSQEAPVLYIITELLTKG